MVSVSRKVFTARHKYVLIQTNMIESGHNSKLRDKKLSVYIAAFIIFDMTESGHKRDTSL